MTALLRAPHRHRQPLARPRPRPRAVEPTGPVSPVQSARQPRPRLVRFVASGVFFTAVLVGNVIVYASITQGQFDLERLQDRASTREAAYQQLRLRVAEAEAPARIVERARGLGMTEPAKVTYLTPTTRTSSTEADAGRPRTGAPAEPPAEAAQSWGRVKPHLDGRR